MTHIHLNGLPLERTPTFKYLGLLLTSDLSWTQRIESPCSKAKQILGLLYRRFYHHSSEQTLRQLYVSLVRPHLEYASPVWDPYLQKDVNLLERIQQFACKLLDQLQLPTLANFRLHMRLSKMNEIIHGLLYFLPDVICPRVTMPHNIRSHLLYQPYACNNAYFDYYVP